MKNCSLAYLPLLLVLVIVFSSCNFKNKDADIIYHNARIYTVDGDFSVKEAMAIKDGKIVAIGPEREILNEYKAPKVIDCQKRFIYPGFIDAHCHFMGYGLAAQQVDLVGTKSMDDVFNRLKAYAEKNPDKDWIVGRGWDQNDLAQEGIHQEVIPMPDNSVLNEMFPDKPVALIRIDGHAMLVNQKALELSGITNTTQINGGVVEVKDGKLTGILIDNAMQRVYDILPHATEDEKRKALMIAQQDCFKEGLTTVDDAGLMHEDIELIKSMHEDGGLKMRIYAMLSDDETNYTHYLKHGIDTTDFLTVRAFKLYADGALGSRGACLSSPYSDVVHKAQYGLMLKDPAYFRMRAEQLYDKGFQMCTHAIGDSANRVMLQIYGEQLQGVNDARWRIEHAQVMHKEDIPLFGKYSIIPSVQPLHATSDMPWAYLRLGKNRLARAYAYRDLKQQLGMLALGTDFPVEEISPLKTFYAAVVRKDATGNPTEGFQMDNALSREEALRGITIWPAIANFEEGKKGSLEVGKWADFVMLDQDIMKVSEDKLPQVKVLVTAVAGEIVYSKQ
jgi:predicted amidohydrolase YtcJ